MATATGKSARQTAGRAYRPLFLDRTGDLRPSVEREFESISNAFLETEDKFKNFTKDKDGYYVYPTGGGGGTSGVSSFKGRTGAVVPAFGDYDASMISGALTKTTADGLYEPKGSAGNYQLPTASASVKGGVKIGSGITVDADGTIHAAPSSSYVLPPATKTTLGGIIVGDNLTIDSSGKLNASASGSSTPVDAYTKAESDAALALKADKATTYTKTEVDDAIAANSSTPPDLSKYLDKTSTTAQTVKGPVTFQNSLLVASGHTVGFTQATHVQVPNNASLPNDAISKEYLETHVYGKTEVDTKIAGISSGGGVTVPETLTNMDGVHTTGWYFTDYHTTPSMSQIPNNYGDYAIVNHVTQSGTNGFAYQIMFTGGAAFGDAASQKTIWFRVNQDNSASAWSTIKWNKIGDTSALEAKVDSLIENDTWYKYNDPKVAGYLDFLPAPNPSITDGELWIKFGKNSIRIKGNIHCAPTTANHTLYKILKAPSGFTKCSKTYGHVGSGNTHVNTGGAAPTAANLRFDSILTQKITETSTFPISVPLFGSDSNWGGAGYFVIDELIIFS